MELNFNLANIEFQHFSGDVIVPKGLNDPSITNATVTEEDEIFLKAAIPNWLHIDTRDLNNITILTVDPKSNQFVVSNQNYTNNK